jgi:hypothetical protein
MLRKWHKNVNQGLYFFSYYPSTARFPQFSIRSLADI